jgi:lysyl-tRNA synthetase class 2
VLQARAELLGGIREFFQRAGVMEVETPLCSRHATTDPALESMVTSCTGPEAVTGRPLYLHTSPEFPMKRLLAAESGPIYQICRVFRNGEVGRLHHPEFTLLEWYRPGFDHHQLMAEVAELINTLLPSPRRVERLSYGEVFQKFLGIDPHRCSPAVLRDCAITQGIAGAELLDLQHSDGWLDLLLTHSIEPKLGIDALTFLYDYPASQASLARIREEEPPVAERFELYIDGIELGNGFHELVDAQEQRERFNTDLQQRLQEQRATVPMDEYLLSALQSGLPDCSGVALGVDRLLMLLTGVDDIRKVLAFPMEWA